MNLTHEYKTVRAIFEKPETGPITYSDPEGVESFETYFTVAPIVYQMSLNKFGTNCMVNFEYHDMVGDTEYLMKYFSRLLGREVDAAELTRIQERLEYQPHGVLKLGNAGKVLGNVLAIIKDFISKYEISCLRFSAMKESRIDLYRAMIKKFLPDWKREEEYISGLVRFVICRPEKTI